MFQLTFININNLHKQIKVFNFVASTKEKKLITKLKLLTFINKNNLHKQIKVFNFVAQTKRNTNN